VAAHHIIPARPRGVGASGQGADAAYSPALPDVHPTSGPDGAAVPQHHEIALMCDDIEHTVAELRACGARFATEVRAADWGRTTIMEVPGAGQLLLYEPTHPTAHGH